MSDKSKSPMTIKELCRQVRAGSMTFDEAIDEMIKANAEPLGRIDYSDFLWNNLGRPTEEQLQGWERQRQSGE